MTTILYECYVYVCQQHQILYFKRKNHESLYVKEKEKRKLNVRFLFCKEKKKTDVKEE